MVARWFSDMAVRLASEAFTSRPFSQTSSGASMAHTTKPYEAQRRSSGSKRSKTLGWPGSIINAPW
jgi:hypothetical protein